MKTPFSVINFKKLPTIFFIISAVIISLMLIKFYPTFVSSYALQDSYFKKYQMEYFSLSFKDINRFFKVNFIVNLCFLFVILDPFHMPSNYFRSNYDNPYNFNEATNISTGVNGAKAKKQISFIFGFNNDLLQFNPYYVS